MISNHSPKLFCSEDITSIENYDKAVADKTKIWHCHHKLEMFYTMDELKAMGRYYHVPARELVFVTPKEHYWWPHKGTSNAAMKNRGRIMSEESRKKMSEAAQGRKLSNETKRKLSAALKGHKFSDEHNRKIGDYFRGRRRPKFSEEWRRNMSLAKRGSCYWYNNGEIQIRASECPVGFVKGRLNNLGTRWYNNGIVELYDKVCPEGFVPGRLKKK